jgi:outer membrane protein assembly factor BamB
MKKLTFQSAGLVILLTLLTAMSMSRCKLFDPKDDLPSTQIGDTLWMHQMPGSDSLFTEPTLAIGPNGDVYYAVGGGTLYWTKSRIRALDPNTGTLRWESPVVDNVRLSSPIVVGSDGALYVIGSTRLYAINPVSGQFNWVWEVPTELPNPDGSGTLYTYGEIGALSQANNGNLIFGSIGSGVYSRALYCVSPEGSTVWYNLAANNGAIQSNTVVGPENRIHYFTTIDNSAALVTVDAASGAILWSKPIYTISSSLNNLALDTDGTIITSFRLTSADPFRMYRIQPINGDILWQSSHESNTNPKLIGPDGVIYQDDNNYSGLAQYTPGQSSATAFPAAVHVNLVGSILTRANQLLTIRNRDWVSTVHAFSQSGQLDWFAPMANSRENAMALSKNGIVIGLKSNMVFAIQGDESIADRGWPKYTHDNRNTSNVNSY